MRNRKLKSSGEIIEILKNRNRDLVNKFKTRELAVFGSYLRDEQSVGSDLDIFVEFEPGYKTFDNYMELKFYLEELLGIQIDLIIKTSLREEIKERVLSEAIYV